MNEDPNTPQLASFDQQAMEQLRPYLLDPREDYPEPYTILEFNGVPFSKIGGLAAISGQKKNGKSFVLTQLMAAILGNGCENTERFLPGLRVPKRTIDYLGHEPRVLYVDTEMEKLSSAKVLRRVHWLCGWDMKQPNDRFSVLWLKTMPKDDKVKPYRKRYELIKLAIEEIHPDVVFIDGLRDLIASINDEESGISILDELGTLAEERKMSIWLALHQNPGRKDDSEEAKMRGWIGTELGNKVSDTLISIKNKTANGVTFKVTQQDARDKDMDDWKFEVTDDAGNLGIPKIIGNGKALTTEPEADSEEDIIAWINKATSTYTFPMTRKDIKQKVFAEIGGQKNHKLQQQDLTIAINRGYLIETAMKQNGYTMLDVAGDLPF